MGNTKRDNRIFATVMAANLAVICFLGYRHNGKINIYPLGIGILLLLLALFYPGGIAIFKIPLEKVGRLLGAVLTVVLLLLLYLLIVWPTNIVNKMKGSDKLKLRWDSSSSTYWEQAEINSQKNMNQQF